MTLAMTFLPLLAQIDAGDETSWIVRAALATMSFVIFAGLWFTIFGSILYLIYFLFSLPMRRIERARLFLDLVEGALGRGQNIEAMILSVAQSRDTSVGIHFHIMAAHIENGLRFGEALGKVPNFLPPQVSTILSAGEKLGDLKKVLPACREILRERPVAVRSAFHYLIIVVLFFSPSFIGVTTMIATFVLPKFKDVAEGMGIQIWPLAAFVFDNITWLILFVVLMTASMAVLILLYLGGPRLVRWFQFNGFPVVDALAWRIPWKRKRLQRTFSAMLAVLLDGGVPEPEAVRLAGECTANEICRRWAARVCDELARGAKLTEAVRVFDSSGGFHWRLANAAQSRGGFLGALRGWHETLDARAFQQEEGTAHVVTTGLVILNGAVVALIAIGMFGLLVTILKGMAFAE
jgi:type II secretory pathway component PulF